MSHFEIRLVAFQSVTGNVVAMGALEMLCDLFLNRDYTDCWTYLSPQFKIEESQAGISGCDLPQLMDPI
ncbi:hypothetical protein Syun_019344 [Stephania yunnanensis]|uniref:Uncharacterized protein n=1 Tax=Stephania yunnanensis TaxID=152371 RepID=A0AAP0IVZ2_9MAGN